MDKRRDFTGVNPDIRLDQILIDSNAHRPALHAMMKSYAVGTNPNFIIDGCQVTVGGVAPANTWALTDGYIFLNGEILKVDNQSGSFNSGTQFLAFSKSTTYDPKGDITYNDGTPRQTWEVNRGIITVKSSIATSELDAINGDNIDDKLKTYLGESTETNLGVERRATSAEALAGTETDAFMVPATQALRDANLITKVVNIGSWDMSTATGVGNVIVAHGLTFSKIRSVDIYILDDAGTLMYPINHFSSLIGSVSGFYRLDATSVYINRIASGTFDSSVFNDGGVNRGYIHIKHTP